jgi:hypothetical protein
MSVKKETYLLVKTMIDALPGIKHFDVWNENVARDGEITPFPTPAVFFEWSSSVWEPSTEGSVDNLDDVRPNQKGKLQFTLHIVISKNNTQDEDEIAHYDVEALVYDAIHFKSVVDPETDFIEGKIQRFSDDTILQHKVWRDWPVIYSVDVMECGKTGIDDTLEDAQPVDFEITPELLIENKVDNGSGKITFNIKS